MQFGQANGFWFYSIFLSDSIPGSFFRIWHNTWDFSPFSSVLVTSSRNPSSNLLVGSKGWHVFIKHLLYACILEIQWWGINNYWSLDISCRDTGVRQKHNIHCGIIYTVMRWNYELDSLWEGEVRGHILKQSDPLVLKMMMRSSWEERDEQREKNIYWLFIMFWALWTATFLTDDNSLK